MNGEWNNTKVSFLERNGKWNAWNILFLIIEHKTKIVTIFYFIQNPETDFDRLKQAQYIFVFNKTMKLNSNSITFHFKFHRKHRKCNLFVRGSTPCYYRDKNESGNPSTDHFPSSNICFIFLHTQSPVMWWTCLPLKCTHFHVNNTFQDFLIFLYLPKDCRRDFFSSFFKVASLSVRENQLPAWTLCILKHRQQLSKMKNFFEKILLCCFIDNFRS